MSTMYFRHLLLEKPHPTPINDLPSTCVKLDGIEFVIHGIVHGDEKHPLSQQSKDFVKTCTKRYQKDGEPVFTEEGLDQIFGLNSIGMYDLRAFCQQI